MQTSDQQNSDPPGISEFRAGLLFWIAISIVALILRGVRWDENYEFAQIMTGMISLDDAHPLRQYALGAYNLQFHSSALMLLINDDPVFLCGFRNLLFIGSTVLPLYLLGAWLSGKSWPGHVAVLFFLMGIHLEFDGVYPQFLWPSMFSNGHVGTAYALVFAGCLAAGHLRWAGLLLGLMPAIHLGQMAPALALAGLFALHCIAKKNWEPLLNAIRYFAVGIGFCFVFYLIQQQFVLPTVTDGPYFSSADPLPIWQARMTNHDMHRQIPTGNIHIVTIATLLVGALGWLRLKRSDATFEAAWFWLGVYALSVIAVTYGIMAAHLLLSADTPYLLLGWLPYRLLNHLPPILIVWLVILMESTSISKSTQRATPILLAGVFLFLLLKPLLGPVVGLELYALYLGHNDIVLFALIGFALGLFTIDSYSRKIVPARIAMILLGCVALFTFHRFGAVIVAASTMLIPVLIRVPGHLNRPLNAFSRVAAVLIVVAIAYSQFENRQHLPVGEFESKVTEFLVKTEEPDALLLAPPEQILLQAQTMHPAFVDMATAYHGSYRPSLIPSIQDMYEAAYGIRFDAPASNETWQEFWRTRTPSEWVVLKKRYAIDYVIAPDTVPLSLRPLVVEGNQTLYRLPE